MIPHSLANLCLIPPAFLGLSLLIISVDFFPSEAILRLFPSPHHPQDASFHQGGHLSEASVLHGSCWVEMQSRTTMRQGIDFVIQVLDIV